MIKWSSIKAEIDWLIKHQREAGVAGRGLAVSFPEMTEYQWEKATKYYELNRVSK
jgi:hypothetical protein